MISDEFDYDEEELRQSLAKTQEAMACLVTTFHPVVVEACLASADKYDVETVADGAGVELILNDLRQIHSDLILAEAAPRTLAALLREIQGFVTMAIAETRTDIPAWQEQLGIGMNS
jgi:hypothetical protein